MSTRDEEKLSPIAVANYLLRKGKRVKMSPLKLIKLVYLCHAWHIATGRGELLSETPEAWRLGPILPSLFYAVRNYGRRPVTYPIFEGMDGESAKPTRRQLEVIDQVFKAYKKRSDLELSRHTHADGTPWDKVWQKHKKVAKIDEDVIYSYFEERLGGKGHA